MPRSTIDRGQLYPQTAGLDRSAEQHSTIDPQRVAAELETLDSYLDALKAERIARDLEQFTDAHDRHGRAVATGPLRWQRFTGRAELDYDRDSARDIFRAEYVADPLVIELPALAPPDPTALEAERQITDDALIDAMVAAVELLEGIPHSLLWFQATTERALSIEVQRLAVAEARTRTLTARQEGPLGFLVQLGQQALSMLRLRQAREQQAAITDAREQVRSHRLRIEEMEVRLAAIATREAIRTGWLRRHHEQLACGSAAAIALTERDLLLELDSRGLVVRDADGQVLEHAVRVVRVLAGYLPVSVGRVDLPARQEQAVHALTLGASLSEVIDRYVPADKRATARETAMAFPPPPVDMRESPDGTADEEPGDRLGPLPPGPGAIFARLNPDWGLLPAGHPRARDRRGHQIDGFALGERVATPLSGKNGDELAERQASAASGEHVR